MGCVGSKADESPAVALCRQRCAFLDEAIHQRYALAEAHFAYFHSLKNVGLSLHRFFVLHLPPQRKGDSSVPQAPAPVHSNSGSSHLRFHSDSDEDSGDDDSLRLHSVNGDPRPLHHHQHESSGSSYSPPDYPPAGYPPAGYPPIDIPPTGYPPSGYHVVDYPPAGYRGFTMNYMRKQPTPAIVYQQRPMNPETVYYGEASSSSYYNNNKNNYQNLDSSYSYNNNYSNYGEFFGSSSQRPPYGGVSNWNSQAEASSSNSKPAPAPPPPPPPPSSTWDFLNPFQTFDHYYPPYTPSLDSREVREEEGIPDLEDEDDDEVVKEIHGQQKFADEGRGGGGGSSDHSKEAVAVDEESEKSSGSELHLHNEASVDDPVEYEVHVVDKEVIDKDQTPVQFQNDSQVMIEIQVQFNSASESGNELAKILEVGKVPHNRKHSAYQVPSKMLHVLSASQPSMSKSKKSDHANINTDVDLATRSKNLSSTLHKLYLWEKKLLEEVKVEEKMRLIHEEKDRRLKRLDEKGAEPHKIDATRVLVISLSMKIRIGIQVVDKISEKINNVRNEELWPQLNDFIQGLTKMWISMLECHHSQCHAMGAAQRLDAVASRKHLSDESLEATLQLEHELLNWAIQFSCWFGAQKGFVRSLNNWLLKCLLYIPEETPDGPVPFSPSRIGAPTLFIICNQWAQSIDRISEQEVVDSMREFATTVLELWERDKLEMRQRMIVHNNSERQVKNLEREDQKIHKELQALEKRIVLVTSGGHNGLSLGQPMYQSETSKSGSPQTSLVRVFEAMEKFTSASLKIYEELLQRIEEDRLAREQEKVS